MCQSHNIILHIRGAHVFCNTCMILYYWIGNRHGNLYGSEAYNGVYLIGFWAVHTDMVYGFYQGIFLQIDNPFTVWHRNIVCKTATISRAKICTSIELQSRCYFIHLGHLSLRVIFFALSILHLNTKMSQKCILITRVGEYARGITFIMIECLRNMLIITERYRNPFSTFLVWGLFVYHIPLILQNWQMIDIENKSCVSRNCVKQGFAIIQLIFWQQRTTWRVVGCTAQKIVRTEAVTTQEQLENGGNFSRDKTDQLRAVNQWMSPFCSVW